ncbi:SDR family oxidoreductase [Agromyces albus]|uniref:SDR family oxidoreductase n=1 Tax=Agromyces albus TaxID=205332 RepID=UPI0027842DAD|nr:SDR family oxidoreductase [Agromyces albus]MDQ0573822.1 NADP-dependent 3-hydroxy acid dehydrogenase YdfG [Agromyces albus]
MTPTHRPVALVTGATGGMGAEIVAELTTTHDVVAVGRSASRLRELQESTGCRTVLVDLGDLDSLRAGLEGLERLDVLVHAAAIADALRVDEASVADWESHLRTNVVAPAELTRLALPMLRKRQGTVMFIGSGASTRPVPGNAVYTATKHALKGLADVLRIDEAPNRVRVTTIAPGQTDTPMLRHQHDALERPYEPERYIRPETVARAVRFVVDATPDVQLTDLAVRPRREIA